MAANGKQKGIKFWPSVRRNLSLKWEDWGLGVTIIGCGHLGVGLILLWFRNTWFGDVIGSTDFWTKVAVFALVVGGIWLIIYFVIGGILPAQKEVYPTKGQLEKEKAERRAKEQNRIKMYQNRLPRLYDKLSNSELNECYRLLQEIIARGNWMNDAGARVVNIVNDWWVDSMGNDSINVTAEYAYLDLQYVEQLIQKRMR